MDKTIKAQCSFCSARAVYDGQTKFGPWAYMCPKHFKMHGRGLGTGRGQKLSKNVVR